MLAATIRPLLLLAALIGMSRSALADDTAPTPEPPPTAGSVAPVYVPVYAAPLSQKVQTTYVPQSVALSGPFEIDDVEGRAVPSGYTAIERPRKHMLYGGLAVFGASYGISALTAAIGQDSSYGGPNPVAAMWIPVAGPFIEMGQSGSATADVFLVGLGAAQLAGAIAVYYGLTSKQTVFVRNDLVGNVTVGPMVARGASGVMMSGQF